MRDQIISGSHGGTKLKSIIKRQLAALSKWYDVALRQHLQQGSKSRAQPAFRLGQKAVTLGLETLDLARIHKKVLADLVLRDASMAKKRTIKRAELFFTEAMAAIEKTHRAGIASAARLNRQNKALRQRTAQLAAVNRHLRQRIVQRKTAEKALEKSSRHNAELFQESHRLQKNLQRLTRRILAAQEKERSKVSYNLRDEIGQTLLGINVRLATLKKAAGARSEVLAKEIAITQRLVEKSVKTINRFARGFGTQHEA